MMYGIGMRSRPQRPATPGLGIGGLQATLMSDWPNPGLAKVAEEIGGGYTEGRGGQDLGAAFARSPTSCTVSICLASRRRSATARSTRSTWRTTTKGLKPHGRKTYVAPGA
jgi:hypothetical protein